MGLFDVRLEYKPFEYPEYYQEGWLPQSLAHWVHTKISMQRDIKDWNENLTSIEKFIVENILLAFAQTEVAVEDYWVNQVYKWFPKYEIKNMAVVFGAIESIHAEAYSYLNESLGLEKFDTFLHDEVLSDRFNLLVKTNADYTPQQLKESPQARRDIAKSLAVFSAFAEGVALYSSFAVLYSFSLAPKGMLYGVSQQMKYSINDESLHSKMGCKLFRHLCAEYPELKKEVEEEIYLAAKTIIELEHKFIDKIFSKGELDNLKAYDLKNFIIQRTNKKLEELNYTNMFPHDKESADQLDWFYTLSAGESHTNFFTTRPTEYSQIGADEDWDSIF
jgi:ribonucleoside-diphosphate reductase beta chain